METIFAKIIRGEVPCHRVHEDDRTLAFLDINPISRGHTLVIPKSTAVTIDQLAPDDAAAFGRALAKVSAAVKKATGCTAYNLLMNNGSDAGQVVPHAHVHVIPRYSDAAGSGLSYVWRPGKLDPTAGKDLAAAIASALK